MVSCLQCVVVIVQIDLKADVETVVIGQRFLRFVWSVKRICLLAAAGDTAHRKINEKHDTGFGWIGGKTHPTPTSTCAVVGFFFFVSVPFGRSRWKARAPPRENARRQPLVDNISFYRSTVHPLSRSFHSLFSFFLLFPPHQVLPPPHTGTRLVLPHVPRPIGCVVNCILALGGARTCISKKSERKNEEE